MSIEQWRAFILFTGILLCVGMFCSFYASDKYYKKELHLTNTYCLKKTKYLFIYFNRNKGEIAKYIFWCQIAHYVWIPAFVITWTLFAIYQTTMLQFISLGVTLSNSVIFFVELSIITYHRLSSNHFGGRREQYQRHLRTLEEQKEAEQKQTPATHPQDTAEQESIDERKNNSA